METLTLAPGAVLLREGSPAERIYLVCSGRLDGGDSRPPWSWSPGEVVGEIACLNGGDQPMTVSCTQRARLLAVSCDVFNGMLLRYPTIGLNLCMIYSQRLKTLHQRLAAIDRTVCPPRP